MAVLRAPAGPAPTTSTSSSQSHKRLELLAFARPCPSTASQRQQPGTHFRLAAVQRTPIDGPNSAYTGPGKGAYKGSPAAEVFQLMETKKEINILLDRLGWPSAILPGNEKAKAEIDKLLDRLERLNPHPLPLRGPETDALPAPTPLLLGEWTLVYASNGTVVTRAAPAQLLLGASQLPFLGISDITQVLSEKGGALVGASNSALFGFGPFGAWRVGIEGAWRDGGDGKAVKVLFDQVSIKPVSVMGIPLPDWLPALTLSTGNEGPARSGADWETTFVDAELRLGRGKTGNTFLFRRKPRY